MFYPSPSPLHLTPHTLLIQSPPYKCTHITAPIAPNPSAIPIPVLAAPPVASAGAPVDTPEGATPAPPAPLEPSLPVDEVAAEDGTATVPDADAAFVESEGLAADATGAALVAAAGDAGKPELAGAGGVARLVGRAPLPAAPDVTGQYVVYELTVSVVTLPTEQEWTSGPHDVMM